MTELFVSPSRKYVIVYKNASSPQEHLLEVTLSELYVNDVSGAASYYKDKIATDMRIMISCVPYELHLEHIKAQDKLSMHVLVSPSRKYAVYVEDVQYPDLEHVYMISLPDDHDNSEIEAIGYLYEKILPQARVTNCLPYESYLNQPGAPTLNPYHPILVAKPKKEAIMSKDWTEPKKEAIMSKDWTNIKLVGRHSGKRPVDFLFSMPRIMVSGLEEELIKQANAKFLVENPHHKYAPYMKVNDYSVVFEMVTSGWEDVETYHPYRLHRKVTVFFHDFMAIFGTGLEDI